ncbi:MAG: two-component system, OmpR family, sensor kinase [Pseudonocardiales bacterium]|nr:two-component system, OmpR family, sensor kinase [Pseudonocardiales bacterium]
MSAGPEVARPRRVVLRATGSVRRRWRLAPLRIRLLLSTIGLLAAVCLVVGSISLLLLRGVLIDQLDQQLSVAAYRSVVLSKPPPDHEPSSSGNSSNNSSSGNNGNSNGNNNGNDGNNNDNDSHGGPDGDGGDADGPRFLLAPGQAVGTLGAHLVNGVASEAGVLDSSGVAHALGRREDGAIGAVPVDGRPHTLDVGWLGPYRLIALHGANGQIVITGLPLSGVDAVLSRLAVIELMVAAAGVLAAGAAATMIVRITLRPLARVAVTAGRVAELPLDRGEVALAERVPEQDTDPRTEVGQVGAALNRMLEHVSGALEARHASETQLRQFLADASHELRTPLAAIRGYAELARRAGPDIPEDTAQALRRVSSQTERMTSLVEDMFLLARLDAGRPLAADPVDLTQLVVDSISDAHAAGPEHRWKLRIPDEAVTVTGDATRLAQVLANLLTNARVHTPPGTSVTAGLDTTPSHVILSVSDNGPGIPRALLPHVFGRFARGDTSRSRAAGSTGLGLAIAHAVTTAHGGTLRVDSVPGSTTFMVALPKVPEYADLPAPSVTQLPVAQLPGPEQAGPEQAGPEQAGSEQTGPEQAGPSGPVLPDRASAGPRPASPRS